MPNRNPGNWFEIAVSDMDRAKKFYTAVLQTELSDMPYGNGQMSSFAGDMSAQGAGGALVKDAYRKPSKDGTLIYFSCNDCATEEARIEPNGGKVMMGKMSIGEYGFIVVAEDTEGNAIGFHSQQ